MRTPKPRPARRGYVIQVILVLVIFGVSLGELHWSYIRTVEVVAGVTLVCAGFQLRHRGINREIKRRK
jgi:protein-S-isoprenylcysteine O-methyltransferase Ste14